MTWAELHGARRGRGLIRADDALRAEAAVGAVTGIAYDSRAVAPGQVFVALKGQHADGTAFARQAIERGAAAVVSETAAPDGVHVPWAIVEDARLALAVLAATFYRDPSREMRVIGITGTNGKTTTAYLLASIFDAAGIRCGILGTVGYRVGDEVREATRTTPEAPEVQALLREMVDKACGACAMEVSSHALSLRRVDGISFAAGIFTNLTRDHLDFHADMDDYFEAKARLFDGRSHTPVIVVDDEWGRRLAARIGPDAVTVSTTGEPEATWRASEIQATPDGSTVFVASGPGVETMAGCRVPGAYNVANALLALAILHTEGVPAELAAPAVAAASVPGRMERVDAGQPFLAVVDYSHKPAAVDGALRALRPLTVGRLVIVLGCGGDRDRAKRSVMGEVAARGADLLIVTDDNPRSEDPAAIRRSMVAGALAVPPGERGEVREIGDRAAAIESAVAAAGPHDTVLVAGKGHETGQEVAGVVYPFADSDVLRRAIEEHVR
jgi:UDP-N-acetylmuramoyl-L-alanyl-D-glutamate--2,6-diaminopimelate ligase